MTPAQEIHAAATILLKGHDAARNKPVSDRSNIEVHVAQMGRNRLKSIISLSEKIIHNQEPKT